VNSGDRRLHLEWARSSFPQRLLDQQPPLADQRLVPLGPVLILQRNELTFTVDPCPVPGMLEQAQREKSHEFPLSREELKEQPRKTDGLVAKRVSDVLVASAGRVALIEEQIDHRGHGRQALRPFGQSRRLERGRQRPGAGFCA
jgi:hypothetical protein